MRKASLISRLLLLLATPLTSPALELSWSNNMLKVHGDSIPGGPIDIWYMEAYCRPNAHTQDWNKTVIGHKTELIEQAVDGSRIRLRCTLNDGVQVRHLIEAGADDVRFTIVASNGTDRISEAQWAQPCMRVGAFTGTEAPADKYDYVKKSWLLLDGKLTTMPTEPWATKARYTPGQVWRSRHVAAADVNPRPLNPVEPWEGLIGCTSSDGKWYLALAFDPWHELFQGVIRCLHSDVGIGGLQPGEEKTVQGKLYLVPADEKALLARYRRDFPAHRVDPEDVYRDQQVLGWRLRIHRALDRPERHAARDAALAEIKKQLQQVVKRVPAKAVTALREISIWLEDDHPRHRCACFHPSAAWLKNNDMLPAKAGGVEIADAEMLIEYAKTQPFMLLHELAHGFHFHELGHRHEGILNAFRAAEASGNYEKVKRSNGRVVRHYALTNEKEYFAEATEAYFGTNDFYPFHRKQLKAHDPVGYALIESVWGVQK